MVSADAPIAAVWPTCTVFLFAVHLYDSQFALLGSSVLKFSVEAPCFCFGVCGCDVSIDCQCQYHARADWRKEPYRAINYINYNNKAEKKSKKYETALASFLPYS